VINGKKRMKGNPITANPNSLVIRLFLTILIFKCGKNFYIKHKELLNYEAFPMIGIKDLIYCNFKINYI
jgi:hypothetical protein